MNCESVKDLILTDYIDGEIDDSMNSDLLKHIDFCAECKAFAQEVQNNLVEPFTVMNEQEPPQQIWNNIEDAIDAKTQPSGLWGFLKNLLHMPRPVFAFNAALIMVILVSLFLTRSKQQNIAVNPSDNDIDMLAYVIEETEFEIDSSNDFGTAIEEYFL